jgi:hypothetical protein
VVPEVDAFRAQAREAADQVAHHQRAPKDEHKVGDRDEHRRHAVAVVPHELGKGVEKDDSDRVVDDLRAAAREEFKWGFSLKTHTR